MGLDQVRLGATAVVKRIDKDAAMENRLKDFGLVPGTQVVCRYRSPSGSVTALSFRGMVLAMRTRDLRKIRVHI